MADQLYLSLWFPNFRLQAMPEKLVSVLHQFARVTGDRRLSAANAYPIGWNEVPTYQRIFVTDERSQAGEESFAENAVAEATEQLYDDTAYEFEARWPLWTPEANPDPEAEFPILWKEQPTTVRITGFGPEFDDASYERNGHIRIDFGLDSPFLLEEINLDPIAAQRVQQNVEKLVAFTLSVEKHCGIASRLLWTESGESIAQKLIDRLQRVN